MATMRIPNYDGDAEIVEKPLSTGRAAAGSSRPVVLSNEDLSALAELLTALRPGSVDLGYTQIAVAGEAVGLDENGPLPDGATYAIVTVGSGSVRWRGDGTDPTLSVGMPWRAGETRIVDNNPLVNLRFIGVSTTLDVTFFA